MGWSESEIREVPKQYSEEIRQIDEQIVRLYAQRKEAASGKRQDPSVEIVKQWTEEYGLDVPVLGTLFHTLNAGILPSCRMT